MKKINVILSILIIIMLLVIINGVRNFIIISEIFKKGENFNIPSNYSLDINSSHAMGTFEQKLKVKDDIYFLETNYDNEQYEKITEISWYNTETKEHIVINNEENGEFTKKENPPQENLFIIEWVIFERLYDFKEIFMCNMFNIITVENNCYKINTNNKDDEFVDKDTGFLIKTVSQDGTAITNIIYKENVVNDEEVEKPENY